MNSISLNVIPLFSSPLGIIEVKEDLSNFLQITKEYNFLVTNSIGSQNTYITENLNILDNFPNQKKILFEYFNFYKNEVLKLTTTNFKITSSWATKTKPQGFSQFHNHRNCIYSGIFYFDEIAGGELEFESYGIYPQQIMVNAPSEWGLYNSTSWKLLPKKNMLVIFPSYLYHRVSLNKSTNDRYSIAFNLFPDGSIGNKDSYMNVKINAQ